MLWGNKNFSIFYLGAMDHRITSRSIGRSVLMKYTFRNICTIVYPIKEWFGYVARV